MKRTAIATLVFALGSVFATASYAQGRHDEKPHGMPKPAAQESENTSAGAGMTGRHDEKPHGTKKKAAKKQRETKPEAAGETKDAGKDSK